MSKEEKNRMEKIQDAIGMIGEDLIVDAKDDAKYKEKNITKKNHSKKLQWVSMAALLAMTVSAGIMLYGKDRINNDNVGGIDEETTEIVSNDTVGDDNDPVVDVVLDNELLNAHVVSKAEYPVMAPYPQEAIAMDDYEAESLKEWNSSRNELIQPYRQLKIDISDFISASTKEFLSESNGDNRLYSPVNVYMALSLLAESTGGNSRQQILDVLGAKDIETLRKEANAVWNANYCNDGAVTSVLANSVWFNEGVDFKQEIMDSIAKNYYASSYIGKMGTQEFNTVLRTWFNENTAGLLKNQIQDIQFDSNDIMALASTIYYSARWSEEFVVNSTDKKIFHGANGDVTVDFMNQGMDNYYYWGDSFSAVGKGLKESGNMYFILPDEGVSIDELVADGEVMKFISQGYKWENRKYLMVNMSVPKFDVESKIDLSKGLNNLGITDVFDSEVADFSVLLNSESGMQLSEAFHGVRVKIDEEGCEAAAYTILQTDGAAMPEDEEIDFVLDRPFLFVITSRVGLPLFIGVVNQM